MSAKATKKTQIQLVSDLHLDTRSYPPTISLPRVAPTIIIAGDLCPVVHPNYIDYLKMVTEGYEQAIYVAGNHEFYGAPAGPIDMGEVIDRVCHEMNTPTYFLGIDRPNVDISKRVRVIGATLWTDVGEDLDGMLNDFTQVPSTRPGHGRFTPEEMGMLHRMDKAWINRELHTAREESKRAVVVSHHSPDRRLSVINEKRAIGGLGPFYYAADMVSTMTNYSHEIIAWCYGHTHESHAATLPDSKVICITNALGYPREKTGYVSGSCFSV